MKTHTTNDGTTLLLFLCAIALSATAAFYAVSGLVAIFAAAVIPIIVMGSMLEISKLVLASWLYRNWKETSFLLRTYFCVALTILMLLTSMGIFGYLSKAHLDQAVPTGDVAAKVAILDEKIKTERENVERARRQLQQMDSQVEQALARTTDDKGTERSVQIRRGQQKERSALLAEIGSAQTRIARLNEERAPISAELRKVEAEVGPLKYVAALLYGDNPDQNILEKAVRFVIIMIVMVFDPLAVLMLIAVNQSTMRRSHGTDPNPKEEKASVEQTEDEPITVSVYASQIPAFQGTITVPEGSAQVTITTTPSSEAEAEPAASDHQLELDFESGGSEPVAVEARGSSDNSTTETNSVAEVPLIDNTKVTDILPVPLGPLAQELRGTADSSIKEVLERPRTGRPERLQ